MHFGIAGMRILWIVNVRGISHIPIVRHGMRPTGPPIWPRPQGENRVERQQAHAAHPGAVGPTLQ